MTDTETVLPSPDPSMPWASQVILRVEVGSTAHGTGLPGVEDYDEMGVWVPPWDHWAGVPVVHDEADTIVYRPGRAEGERSGPGDYDLVLHSARKFCRLAATCNPSILVALFGPVRFSTPLGWALRDLAPAVWHQEARMRFLGYARQQRERLLGVRGGKHTNRPELIEEFGYDTKYAMHMIRLGLQGIEYMNTGRIELPIPEPDGEFLRAIRRGEFSMDEVVAMAEANEERLKTMPSAAPENPNWAAMNRWLREATLR